MSRSWQMVTLPSPRTALSPQIHNTKWTQDPSDRWCWCKAACLLLLHILFCFLVWFVFAQNGRSAEQASVMCQIKWMENQCSCKHYEKFLPHISDKAEIVSAASGYVCFLMIYMCDIFAMLLLDFPHALLLATSKLICYMFL